MNVIRNIVVAVLAMSPVFAQADNHLHPGIFKSAWIYLDQGDGLIANIPAHEHPEVIKRINVFRAALETRKAQCAEEVSKTQFSAKDALITVIMPGGLLFAANRRHQHSAAQDRLSQVTGQLQDLKMDLDHLKAASSRDSIAYLGQP